VAIDGFTRPFRLHGAVCLVNLLQRFGETWPVVAWEAEASITVPIWRSKGQLRCENNKAIWCRYCATIGVVRQAPSLTYERIHGVTGAAQINGGPPRHGLYRLRPGDGGAEKEVLQDNHCRLKGLDTCVCLIREQKARQGWAFRLGHLRLLVMFVFLILAGTLREAGLLP